MPAKQLLSLCSFVLLSLSSFAQHAEQKPFTRWWWMGSAVNEQGIKYNLEAFHKAGIGGVEITPIYGVRGEESNYIPFLSEKYMHMLDYTVKVADSLGMKVDMVQGTGWPFGGAQVEAKHAATKLMVDSLFLKKGETVDRDFEVNQEGVALLHVLAFGANAYYKDLSDKVEEGRLRFQADRDLTLYAVYAGKTAQKVKRAAPGGEGFTVDHYSQSALEDYLEPYNEKLKSGIRAVFNDSYEVYGTDFTPHFFEDFEALRGYDLKPHLPLLIQKENSEKANRIRGDYRETISDLLKTRFDRPWTKWAHEHGYRTKLQAHGSPGNLLDLYATADIPECETFGSMPFDIPGFRREADDIREGDADPVMLKFSSSAGHVMGKPLISSETFTWLRDHFKTALSQCKPELEELLLNGVNHVFFHGSTYSPPEAEWPGWKFYASVNFSPQMTIWKDAPALFRYIKNCQTLLQIGQPDNEIGLYWPIHDVWNGYHEGRLLYQFQIHSLKEWLLDTPFYALANELMDSGYSVDFLSDEFIATARVESGKIVFNGGAYKALVVPKAKYMPLATLDKLKSLKAEGATIIFEDLPESVPGFRDFESRALKLNDRLESLVPVPNVMQALKSGGVEREEFGKLGLKFIRRKHEEGYIYFVVNHGSKDFEGFLNLQSKGNKPVLFDPDTEMLGMASQNAQGAVRIQLKAGKSIFIRTDQKAVKQEWSYYKTLPQAVVLHGPYTLKFLEGGPVLPPAHDKLEKLGSWTELGQEEADFSGTAMYSFEFVKPKTKADAWALVLPDVRESARIWLNGKYLGTLWANPFTINLTDLKAENTLKIEVTNLTANRLRAKEMRGEEWKIFHEINMVNKDYKPFDAKKWKPMPSGIVGEIKLVPLEKD
ncbi:glycoside hydrolase [Marinilongibacter aquaticus]|uniref:glycosyl hydrolase n=1 Tax=Marinilongibacter aquaticus TaxID=2975157 RepID=UPI0021BD9877|nr:glycosyl hydrolase [Marinilongibacter aquaticus]UBM58349.1 glycoside hydrolase [Marinilongibacter aquaticus]